VLSLYSVTCAYTISFTPWLLICYLHSKLLRVVPLSHIFSHLSVKLHQRDKETNTKRQIFLCFLSPRWSLTLKTQLAYAFSLHIHSNPATNNARIPSDVCDWHHFYTNFFLFTNLRIY